MAVSAVGAIGIRFAASPEEQARAAALLTRVARGFLARARARRLRAHATFLHTMATRVQCVARACLARKELAFRRRRRFHGQRAARRVQKLWWTALYKWHKKEQFHRDRLVHEQLQVAFMQLQKTIHYQHIDFTWSGAKKVRQTDAPQLELQRFFSSYASAGMLDVTGLIKMVKDCHDLLDKKVFNIKVRPF